MLLEVLNVLLLILVNFICYASHDKSVVRGSLKGPKLFFVSNSALGREKKSPTSYWALETCDPTFLVTSFILNDVCVFLLRVIAFIFFGLTLILEGLTGDGFGSAIGWFTFFTNWTFLLFGLWSLLGVALTGWYIQVAVWPTCCAIVDPQSEHLYKLQAKINTRDGKGSQEAECLVGVSQPGSTEEQIPSLVKLKWSRASLVYLFVTETVAASTLFLSFFYWAFLFSPQNPIAIDNLLKHGVNNVILLLDIFCCRVPFISYHYQVALLYGTVYTLFMWVYHAASLHWVYNIMDWSQPTALLLYVLSPLFLFLAFMFWFGVACLREWVGSFITPQQQCSAFQQLEFQ